ncbi:stage II sporulation protein M [Bacillus badius]|nr:stage II sporulation protein M [Bacillus badius]MED4718732.1 stage II sporulation protein M [Bacillus badius]
MTNLVNKVLIKRAINFFIYAVAVTIIATIITYIINPDLKEVMGGMEGLEDSSSVQIKESTGMDKVWSYVVHNGFTVPLQMFILALIPIQFLYFVNIISTISLLGVVFGIVLQADFVKGFELIISSIPHSIFEIFAYCLLAAVLFELNQVVRIKLGNIFRKAKERNSFIKKFLKTIRTYVVFVLPIIFVAAFLETYIADTILNLFQ